MNRTRLNAVVDAVTALVFIFLASTGLFLYFILPSGSRGDMVWGMTRQEWGDVHFWLSVAILVLIGVHVVLHRKWIWAMIVGKPSERRRGRATAVFVVLAVVLALAAAPFFAELEEVAGRGGGLGLRGSQSGVEQLDEGSEGDQIRLRRRGGDW